MRTENKPQIFFLKTFFLILVEYYLKRYLLFIAMSNNTQFILKAVIENEQPLCGDRSTVIRHVFIK